MVVSPQECLKTPDVVTKSVEALEAYVDDRLKRGYRNIVVADILKTAGQYSYNVQVAVLRKYRSAGWEVEESSGSQRDPHPLSWTFTEVA